MFITAGGRQVDPALASEVAGEALERADANKVRASTGFAIGGVAPIGHLTPSRVFFDETLLKFATVYAAAGTPRHIFPIDPRTLAKISNSDIAAFSR